MIIMMNALHRGETGSWTRTNACHSCVFVWTPWSGVFLNLFFPVLLFKVFSRFLFFGKVGSICHDIVNLQTFLLLYLVRYTSILSKIYPLVITMVTHANGLQTRALVDQVYTGIKKCLVYCTNTYLMAVETGSWDFWKQIFLFRCSSSLSQSPLTAEWPRSWSGTAASGLGIC